MLGSLDELAEWRLQEICDQRWSESQTLEFKSALPVPGDAGKREFLKEVCALANATGGDIVYGIQDVEGYASSLSPLQTGSESADAAVRRLGQILDSGLEPRLSGIRFVETPVRDGYVLLLRVPASFSGPHGYRTNDTFRFVMRNHTHTTTMSYEQIRAAFDRTSSITERIRKFRTERLALIADRRTPRFMTPGPACVLHVIPFSSMADRSAVNLRVLYENPRLLKLPTWHGQGRNMNLDGLVVYDGYTADRAPTSAYAQAFRNGAVEVVVRREHQSHGGDTLLSATYTTLFFRHALNQTLQALAHIAVDGPIVIAGAILGIAGYQFQLPEAFFQVDPIFSDRQDLIFPDFIIESYSQLEDFDQIARPLLDTLWHGFCLHRCLFFDEAGKWAPPPNVDTKTEY